jgi:hypothetical protein
VVKDKPDKPPSIAQLEIRNSFENQEQSDFKLFKQSLKNLFKNINFILILISYGRNIFNLFLNTDQFERLNL